VTTRMYCIDCRETDFAETRIPGHDEFEMVAWLLGGLPGWLYCAFRHALRGKLCTHCGSEQLMRETRAAAARAPALVPRSRIESRARFARWPAHLRDPRRRLTRGPIWLGAWLLFGAGFGPLAAALIGTWLASEALGIGWQHLDPRRCRAWDATGRPLRIELA
jgi:hypothetical protein